ncbi:MAG: GNAT family N-acetyltransferase [Oscillochloridaceae bacterium umkhey_bin13]
MMLSFLPMSHAGALELAHWRYPAPYDYYNIADEPTLLASFLASPQYGYFAIYAAANDLVAFCCFGDEAQVPGGDYPAAALDVGLGVRPDLTGRGQGLVYLNAILNFADQQFGPGARRLTVASFNARAIRLYQRAGFVAIQHFTASFSGRPFVVMGRDAGGAG